MTLCTIRIQIAAFLRGCSFLLILYFLMQQDSFAEQWKGQITGHISPSDISVRIVVKLAGSDYHEPENVMADMVLKKGGAFVIKGVPKGRYDLLFFLLGDTEQRYVATRWSEVVVSDNYTTPVNYRLTPIGEKYLVDEVLVGFNNVDYLDALKVIDSLGGVVKDTPLEMGATTVYIVDIPDDKSVIEMVKLFQAMKGVEYAEPNGISSIQQ